MKALPILLAILLLPAFVWWSDLHYQRNLHPRLAAAAERALASPDFAGVRVTVDYLDARLEGTVATPLRRFDAERLIDGIPGLRVRPRDNRLTAPAHLDIRREMGSLHVSGLLPKGEEAALYGLFDVNTRLTLDEVAYHSHVSSPLALGDPELKGLLAEFFALSGDRGFAFDAAAIRLHGSATRELEGQWGDRIATFAPTLDIDSQLTLYPSRFHLPGYRASAPITIDTYVSLSRLLEKPLICFDAVDANLPQGQSTHLSQLAEQLVEASPRLPLAIGGYVNASAAQGSEEAQAALARAARVREALVEAGMNGDNLEIHRFDASPHLPDAPRNTENCVEIVII